MHKNVRYRLFDIIVALVAFCGAITYETRAFDNVTGSTSMTSMTTPPSVSEPVVTAVTQSSPICDALNNYPKASNDLSFHTSTISAMCKPFVKQARAELDRCGVKNLDPYTSSYTWPSRNQLSKRGKGNLYMDPSLKTDLERLPAKIEEVRNKATNLCCGPDDVACREGMAKVEVEVCKPNANPDEPDPCVFGGSFHMAGSAYRSIFEVISKVKGTGDVAEMRKIAQRNLSQTRSPASDEALHGKITLSSYVPLSSGIAATEPVLLHEFGHACSMVRMRDTAVNQPSGQEGAKRAMRATEWIDSARRRCSADFKTPDATYDFWSDLGENRELAQCLNDLAGLNQRKEIDKPCNGLCPGHYIEESVGIAFTLLLGELKDGPESVLPNTCDHVRDGQHPLVSDVVECFAQHSPRFRDRVRKAYGCSDMLITKNTQTQ